jgi:hypothetical protein
LRSRPAIYLGGAALLLLAALLTVFVLSRIGSTKAAGEKWERVRGTPSVFGGKGGRTAINAVAAGGPGLVAVGYESPDAAVWTSKNGFLWRRVAAGDPAFSGGGVEGMSAIAAVGPGLVAVGGDHSTGNWDAAVWTSRNGSSWTRVGARTAALGGVGTQLMRGVAGGGPGLIAVGSDNGDAAVWTSRRGSSWIRIHPGEGVFGGKGTQEMNAVAAGGPGLVAVGASNGDAAVWTSADGANWSRVPDQSALGGTGAQKMFGVAAGRRELVAVGYDDGAAAAWASKDGRSWKRVPIKLAASSRVAVWSEMLGVSAGGPGFVAAGVVSAGYGGSDAAVWTSKNGLSWESIPDSGLVFGFEGNQAMAGIAAAGPGLVAVGDDGDAAAVWTSSP